MVFCLHLFLPVFAATGIWCSVCISSSLQTLCHFTKQLLEALSYLHSQGIVHNDLRPSLVFMDGGGVKLGGFSIVKRCVCDGCLHAPPITSPTNSSPYRLADLHRTMNVHMKHQSVADDLGAWPPGRMGGKKGDILKLVCVKCLYSSIWRVK